jgi:hypothetical protein
MLSGSTARRHGLKKRRRAATFSADPIPPMKPANNYALEFGIVLRAVCPMRTGPGR